VKKSNRKPISETFAETIIEELKKGTAPWQKPWKAGEYNRPMNPVSGTVYKGINTIMLARHGYADPRWMTMKQANDQEWRVKKGSRAQQVVFWQWTDRQTVLDDSGQPVRDEKGEEQKENVQLDRPRLHVFSVFHASQLQTLDSQDIPAYEPPELTWDPIERGEKILQDSGATIIHDQANRAYYQIMADEIHLPLRENFPEAGNYYSTALHELGHWTGHSSRMDREFGPRGSETYAKEELRAEIASWMLNQELGLPHQSDQHVSYVDSWVTVLQKDPHEIMRASRDAEKIKEYVMDLQQELTAEQHKVEAGLFVISGNTHKADVSHEGLPEIYQEYPTAQKAGTAFKAFCAAHDDGALHCEYQQEDKIFHLANRDYDHFNRQKLILKFDGLEYPAPQEMKDQFMAGYQNSAENLPQEVAPAAQETLAETKTFLRVPYREKNNAKAAGAKWDGTAKLWYAPEGASLTALATWLPEKEAVVFAAAPSLSPVEEFAQTLQQTGLIVDEPLMDGQIHRVPVLTGKAGTKDGAYCGYSDGRPNGWGQNYKTGEQVKWIATGHTLSAEEKEVLKMEASERLAARETERKEQQAKAMKRAYAKWMNAEPTVEHPYLAQKGVEGFGLKQDRQGNLLIPGFDPRTGRLQTLQWIDSNGTKGFEKGCPQQEAVFVIPSLESLNNKGFLIAEGYATAASLHMATDQPVVAVFNASNLQPVTEILREQYPQAEITLCADNDHHLPEQINGIPLGNVGLKKAQKAAQAIDAAVVVPSFTKEEKALKYTDFNDLHKSRGLDAVTKRVKSQTVEMAR